ncbi:MAG: histidinol-phosphatase [Treponema sp.]|nr:histidinol-phosphatase [Treponema sp.]
MKINFHTHTTYCDGKNSAEEMVLSAIAKGFDILGFSSHSMFPFGGKWHIAPREHVKYVEEIRSLAEKFKDKIDIRCGFEADYFPGLTVPDHDFYKELKPDFLIGSVHYVASKKGHYSADTYVERIQQGIGILYGEDKKRAVCDYFQAQREMLNLGNFDIWGHPDVIRKRNAKLKLFDESESWYKDELKATVKEAQKAGVIAEINTGAIARGAMDDFYPSEYFLTLIYEAGIPVMINSDCHNAEDLDCAFDRAIAYAKKIGFKEVSYPEAGSIKHFAL